MMVGNQVRLLTHFAMFHSHLHCRSSEKDFEPSVSNAYEFYRFTVRNVTVNNAVTAVSALWGWAWTWQGVTINNCSVRLCAFVKRELYAQRLLGWLRNRRRSRLGDYHRRRRDQYSGLHRKKQYHVDHA